MKLIVGLGNPGAEYEKTRHNAGFMVVDRLATRHGLSGARMKFHSGVIEGRIAGQGCALLQPMTYMNRSGQAVAEAIGFFKLEPSDVMIVVDDVALPVGRIRLRADGSAGGHNGLADIQRALGGAAYPRLRVGIDAPGRVAQRDYVLGRFTAEQLDAVAPAIERACDAIECWLTDGIDKAMNLYNADA